MDIFVVSRSRFVNSDTLNSLGTEAHRAQLVVPSKQVGQYAALAKQHKCTLVACPVDGIALTRQYCGQICKSDRFIMFDDDLKFYRRIGPKDWHLRYPSDIGAHIADMLGLVAMKLNKYVHVAISAREGNNRLPYEGVECSRPLRALAYRKDKFLALTHGRVKIMEDFDVTLQLLKQGYKNHVIAMWAQGQLQTQMEGGCSDYRTKELHNSNVELFAKLHAPFVKLRLKKNKTGGEFGERTEATIYWQKAYESASKETPLVKN